MQAGPCIPAGTQLWKAGVGPTSGPTGRLSHLGRATVLHQVHAAGLLLRRVREAVGTWERQNPLSQRVQEGRQAPRKPHIHGMEVHRKCPGGSSEPPEPRICFSPVGTVLLLVRGVEHEHEEADGAAHLGSGRVVLYSVVNYSSTLVFLRVL